MDLSREEDVPVGDGAGVEGLSRPRERGANPLRAGVAVAIRPSGRRARCPYAGGSRTVADR